MRLHEIRQIDRPLDDVFAYVADFANAAEWDPGVSSASQIGDDAVGVGVKYDVMVSFGPSEIPMVYEITEFEPNRRVVLSGSGKTLDAVDVIEFESRDGGTMVEYTADLTFKNWVRFVTPVMSPLVDRVGEKALDGMVESLSI